jgi:hypothetical protein
MSDDFICCIEQLTFRAIASTSDYFPSKVFIEALDERGRRDFCTAARVLATSLASGRPPAGRSERVRGSGCGLFELRITPCGRCGPHVRLLYVREQNTIWCIRGVVKRERLRRSEIEAAEQAVKAWRARR